MSVFLPIVFPNADSKLLDLRIIRQNGIFGILALVRLDSKVAVKVVATAHDRWREVCTYIMMRRWRDDEK
jgi:hypothetical protein